MWKRFEELKVVNILLLDFAFWYEKINYLCFFRFIYEPQFIADFAVNLV